MVLPPALAAPRLEAIDSGSIRVTWSPAECNPTIEVYTVWLRAVGSSKWLLFDAITGKLVERGGGAVEAPSTECCVHGLSTDAVYEATVTAGNAIGWSVAMSAVSLPLCLASCTPPVLAAPRLEAIDSSSIRVTWSPAECNPTIEVYTVRLRAVGSSKWLLFDASTGTLVERGGDAVEAPSTECCVRGLSTDAVYEATVTAGNAIGWSVTMPAVSPSLCLASCTPPELAAPRLEAIDSSSIRVTWLSIECTPAVEVFTVWLRAVGSSKWLLFDASTGKLVERGGGAVEAPSTECCVHGLSTDTAYEATVVARNAIGWSVAMSAVSPPLCIGACRPPRPSTPRLLRENSSTLRVRWDRVVCAPLVTAYVLHMRRSDEKSWKDVDTHGGNIESIRGSRTSELECVLQGLIRDARYDILLEARNCVGWSLPSIASESHTLAESRKRQLEDDGEEHSSKFRRIQTSTLTAGCAYFQDCIAFVKSLPANIQRFFDYETCCLCYCNACHASRGDRETYMRGGSKYALPIGWARVSLRTGGAQAEVLGAFQWPVAFHGTPATAVPFILATGRLVRPGESVAVLGGGAVGIRTDTGRIKQPSWRINLSSGEREYFDPNQIFCSPSIRYCELPHYAKTTDFTSSSGKAYQAKLAFQMRLRPGTYGVGQQTVRANKPIDKHFSNNEIEWYTEGSEHGAHVLTGLLVKLTPRPASGVA